MGCFVFTVYPSIGEAQTTGINKTGTVPLEPSWKVKGGRGKVGGHQPVVIQEEIETGNIYAPEIVIGGQETQEDDGY